MFLKYIMGKTRKKRKVRKKRTIKKKENSVKKRVRRTWSSKHEFKPKYNGYDFIIPSKKIDKTIKKLSNFIYK